MCIGQEWAIFFLKSLQTKFKCYKEVVMDFIFLPNSMADYLRFIRFGACMKTPPIQAVGVTQ